MKSEEWSVGSFPHLLSSFVSSDRSSVAGHVSFLAKPTEAFIAPTIFSLVTHEGSHPSKGKSHNLASNFELTPAHVNLRLPLLTGRRHWLLAPSFLWPAGRTQFPPRNLSVRMTSKWRKFGHTLTVSDGGGDLKWFRGGNHKGTECLNDSEVVNGLTGQNQALDINVWCLPNPKI